MSNWLTSKLEQHEALGETLEQARLRRERITLSVEADLVSFALAQGYTEAQARSAIESLFRTYLSAWMLYLFIGADDIITAIQNDATLPWLNTPVAGKTIRQRLIERLSA